MPTDKHNSNCLDVVPELPVANLVAAQRWFRDTLGFQTAWVWEDSFAAVCNGEVQLYLRRTDSPAHVRCYLHVEDADRLYVRCKEQGGRIVDELGAKPWGAREFAVETPDGHILRIGHGERRVDEISQFKLGDDRVVSDLGGQMTHSPTRAMTVDRLKDVPGFSIDRVAAAAGADPDVLRLENLDTDLRPPKAALEATRAVIDDDDANSYLPFIGSVGLREAVARHVSRLSGVAYDPDEQCVITAGGTEGMLNVLLATLNPGDEVLLTDPTYAGMICRVRLAGGVPRLVPFVLQDREWRLDLNAFAEAISDRTRVVFLMNPSMPSGAVLDRGEWEAIAALCVRHSLWLLYNAAMERILYDGRPYLHPAGLPGMAERTLTVGSVSKEYRMIGWRVGWVVGPPGIMADVAKVGIYNVVTPVGLTQNAAAAALGAPKSDLATAITEWQRRRDLIVEELRGEPLIRAAGGWSMLLDVSALGFDSLTASDRLLDRGKIAATPMRHWGQVNGDRFVRLVFSNEPVSRLASIGHRVRAALKT